MFFGRIYSRGRAFKPSWRSYSAYAGIVVLILLGFEFDVLNAVPDNRIGGVLLAIPAFYLLTATLFLLNDAALAAWGWLTGRSKTRKRR